LEVALGTYCSTVAVSRPRARERFLFPAILSQQILKICDGLWTELLTFGRVRTALSLHLCGTMAVGCELIAVDFAFDVPLLGDIFASFVSTLVLYR
jgi:hypothetical protein